MPPGFPPMQAGSIGQAALTMQARAFAERPAQRSIQFGSPPQAAYFPQTIVQSGDEIGVTGPGPFGGALLPQARAPQVNVTARTARRSA
jgi:hypothetical protein